MPVYYGVPGSPSDLSALDEHLAYTIPATGMDTAIIDLGWVQDTKTSTTIYPLYGQNPNFGGDTTITDDELNTTIAHLKAQGLKVGLKCHLWTLDNGYASDISPSRQWFDGTNGYRNYIKHYASIAQAQNLDTFIIGNELGLASYASDTNWGHVIADVRARYSGPISYAALCEMTNTGTYPVTPEHTSWWSGLDYMGINAYYDVTPGVSNPTLAQLEAGWVTQAQSIDTWWHALPAAQQKPLVFTEVGRSGGNTDAANTDQANYYEAMFSAMWGKYSWFKGTDYYCTCVGYLGPSVDTPWPVDGRPAEAVIKSFYAPEPGTLMLLSCGLAASLLAFAWRKRKEPLG